MSFFILKKMSCRVVFDFGFLKKGVLMKSLLLIFIFLPLHLWATCYVDADLACPVKATDLTWSKGQNIFPRNFLFNTDNVQNNYYSCKAFAKLIQTECQFDVPVTSVF